MGMQNSYNMWSFMSIRDIMSDWSLKTVEHCQNADSCQFRIQSSKSFLHDDGEALLQLWWSTYTLTLFLLLNMTKILGQGTWAALWGSWKVKGSKWTVEENQNLYKNSGNKFPGFPSPPPLPPPSFVSSWPDSKAAWILGLCIGHR